MKTSTRFIFLGIFLLFLSNGCALYDQFFGKGETEMLPEELMSEGMKDVDSGNYKNAIEKFQEVKDRYPYSRYAIEAELKVGDAYFKKGDYDSAYNAYDEYERMHPRDKNIPYAIYQKGMSHFRQIESIDREQTHTLSAKDEFERLIKRFPKDPHANKARRNIRECLIFLAEYELYVGRFYFRKGKYKAAMDRFLYLIMNYPDMGQYHHALEYISLCKERLSETVDNPPPESES
ncbi:MAG: outer membrane protein assembly factor BamD [Deltaproteobacteria bacterium]|nr:outer membrane protein assembly factor BamD [Deltaproteobacteria bacterium]